MTLKTIAHHATRLLAGPEPVSRPADNPLVARLRILALQAETRQLPGARLLARASTDTAANLSTIIENSEATRSALPLLFDGAAIK